MSDRHNPHTAALKRRLALQALSGSALAGGLMDKLPGAWQSPLVKTSVLPAHAQSSPLAQFTLEVMDTSDPQQPPGQFVLSYMLMRDQSGAVETMMIPQTAFSFAGAPAASDGLNALFPAAYAQEIPTTSAPALRLRQDAIIDFQGGVRGSAVLELDYDGGSCSITIEATLLPDRSDLNTLETSPVSCGDFMVDAAPGENSGFGEVNPLPPLRFDDTPPNKELVAGSDVDDLPTLSHGVPENAPFPAAVGGGDQITYQVFLTSDLTSATTPMPDTTSQPSLPPGLSFNPDTRQLSGRPTQAMPPTSYTYRAEDIYGRVISLEFNIHIDSCEIPPPNGGEAAEG